MIGQLTGMVFAVRIGHAIISAGGVGYKVFATRELLATLRPQKEVALWTHLAVRETILDLYGFSTEEELRLFELLLTVSGIGPRSGLAILDIASVETLRSAIAGGNASYLTKVSGIGRKTAEKIVLELKDKVGIGGEGGASALRHDEEALEAMKALGYSQGEARDALRKVPQDVERSSDRLREALRILGRQ
ncbi:Holliday junction DNA helicase RuvA [Candidatus Kaiserbacteria bacterium RIFCSPHIGHO2_01_FULL_53_29]|uniref:Holliday junction branch migration complex subunit RuvA n=1 Tax=Candidatus Kaiserbacteria bacterium RIFCSPHIGHO2_01_FULL_53_29 TaxID=1798480 RepID=A0A1F6CT81_9BACT|nr:MAG: Holliday junction DNA helicase RuvA [Candidatus Kaiserbacteria bacterium RIFCSPHIGHO2_01_FULL_53_29]